MMNHGGIVVMCATGTIVAVCLAITMVMALWQLNDGSSNTSIGDLVAINAYVLQLWAPLSSLAKSYRGMRHLIRGFPCLHREKPVTDRKESGGTDGLAV